MTLKVINLFGGPGSGKSTTAAALFAYLKNKGIDAELVGEEAKAQLYWGSAQQLQNQVLLAGLQYARLKNLERHGCKLAISDSPLIMQLAYCEQTPYFKELSALIRKINDEFLNTNVRVIRTKHYSPFGRVQKTVEEAAGFDAIIDKLVSFDYSITGDASGQLSICQIVEKQVQEKIHAAV